MKILICDDEYATRVITKSYLNMYSLETVEAANGKEALSVIEEEKPDLLIIDYSMPDMTGLEVIKELDGMIPVIVVTSEGFTLEIEKELKRYSAGYLTKPITETELIGLIQEITGENIVHE